MTQFIMDGKEFNVHVMSLTRSFTVKDGLSPSTAQSGAIYRDLVGTYYDYQITVSEKDGDRAALEAFWEAVSKPVNSHVCVFPYGQKTLTQRMYVTKGKQNIRRLYTDRAEWDDITVSFIANEPKVIP